MAVLNDWQKLDRVLNGQPFGNGVDGAYSSATIPTLTKDSCSGTATSTTLTTTGSTFANGDVLLIHQTRGTNCGVWEINRVSSGGGTTSLTLQIALNYTYTDSGASQAQAVKVPQYTDCTVQSGTWTVPTWNGNVGGVAPFAIKGTLTVTGTISAMGNNASGRTPGSGTGYSGGIGGGGSSDPGTQGEGEVGAGAQSTAANGEGGGGGASPAGWGGAGGAGSTNAAGNGGTTGGTGFQTVSDLTTHFVFGGGAGGGGCQSGSTNAGGGGGGGGLVSIFAKTAIITGGITLNGGNGATGGSSVDGGGGAGGCALLVVGTVTLGSNLITSTAGAAGGGAAGTAGTVGAVAVHHSGTITGTTNPTFTDVTDTSLVESGGGAFFAFF